MVRCRPRFIPLTMMWAKCLTIAFLVNLVVAELPSFITVCGRRNPNLDKCVSDAMEKLRDRLKTGIPEMNLAPQDPLHIEEFSLSNTDSFKVFAHNVTVKGLTEFIIKSNHIDFEARQFKSILGFKKVIIDGEYDVDSKIVIPLVAHGPFHIEADDVECGLIIKYEMVKVNGVDHLRYTSVIPSLSVKDWRSVFTPTATMDKSLIAAIEAVFEGARKEIFESLRPNIEKVISEMTMEISQKVTNTVTFDELFPDRE